MFSLYVYGTTVSTYFLSLSVYNLTSSCLCFFFLVQLNVKETLASFNLIYLSCSSFRLKCFFCVWLHSILPTRRFQMGHSWPLLIFFCLFNSKYVYYKNCWWLYSNNESLDSEATTLPTELQPLTNYLLLIANFVDDWIRNISHWN